MENKKILLGLTSTSRSDWRKKIIETRKYEIKEVALFLTGLKFKQREILYELLKNSPVKNIPHVHLRNDMKKGEVDYLVEKYKTKVFNIHPHKSSFPSLIDYGEHSQNIYVENVEVLPNKDELKKYGGICIDFSHWEEFSLKGKIDYCEKFKELVGKNNIGCSHVSAVKKILFENPFVPGAFSYSSHWMKKLQDLNYMGKYKDYLPDLISLELENSFEDQLKAKKYLENLLE